MIFNLVQFIQCSEKFTLSWIKKASTTFNTRRKNWLNLKSLQFDTQYQTHSYYVIRTVLSSWFLLAHLIYVCVYIFCIVLSLRTIANLSLRTMIFAEMWTPWTDKIYLYHIPIIPKGSLWGLLQKCDFHMKILQSPESWHQSYYRSRLKVLLWLCSTWDYILSRMNIRIPFSSKLTHILDGPCNCLGLSIRKWLPSSIVLTITDNLHLA